MQAARAILGAQPAPARRVGSSVAMLRFKEFGCAFWEHPPPATSSSGTLQNRYARAERAGFRARESCCA